MIEKQKDERINVQIISIDQIVPANHLLRNIDKTLDFNFIYDLVKDKPTHTACDKNGFVVSVEVTPGNVHDSKVFDKICEKFIDKIPQIENFAVDAGYKTPWICKKNRRWQESINAVQKTYDQKRVFQVLRVCV